MITVSFINVEHGDSIILQWENSLGDKKVAIIDCNKTLTEPNPTYEYISKLNIDEIYFVLLSHPHFDHYSGLEKLIDQFSDIGISIRNFIHTSQVNSQYLKMATKGNVATNSLQDLYLKLGKLHNNNETNVSTIASGLINTIPLNDFLTLKVLAPSKIEIDKYISSDNFNYVNDEEQFENNAKANLLSSIISISSNEWHIILTADAEKSSFLRLMKEEKELLNKELVLAQCPHHGSIMNFSSEFWRNIRKKSKTPIVFSAGKNHYKHPSKDIISKLLKYDYEIYSTNLVGGLVGYSSETEDTIDLLDMYSVKNTPTNSTQFEGNKSFSISADGVVNFLSN